MEEDAGTTELVRYPWEDTLEDLANSRAARITVPRSPDLNRRKVVEAFTDAFQLIGGTPRLALWADANPTEFYRLYAKLMPKENPRNEAGTLIINHAVPKSPLDGDPTSVN